MNSSIWAIYRLGICKVSNLKSSLMSRNDSMTGAELTEFGQFRDFLEKTSGIDLPANKSYLVATRLRKIMLDQGVASLAELVGLIRGSRTNGLRNQVIDAMTTNETFWFRDNYPFEYFKSILLPKLASGSTKIRVWCAACSSGQEPYSLAMIIDEFLNSGKARNCQIEIVATDLSDKMLERCKTGIYDQIELTRGLPKSQLVKYFDNIDKDKWQLKDSLRRKVSFQKLNLKDAYTSMGKFDIIFCRNVLIYFSADLKSDIIKRLQRQLQNEGTLFLGASEGLGESSQLFEMIHCNPGIAYKNAPSQ